MIRKYALAIAGLALPLSAMAVGPSVASAAVRPHSTVTFKGKISCTMNGYLHFTQVKHPTLGLELLTKENTRLWLQVTLTACKGTTSQGGSKITGGTVYGSVTGDYSCAGLLSAVPSPTGFIKWKTKGKAATNSIVALSDGTLQTKSKPLGIDYKAAVKDSFAGSGTVKAAIYQTEGDLINACKTSPYLRKVTIDPKASTISI